VRRVLAPGPAFRHAIDLVLNGAVDEPITRWDDAFLPEELQHLVDESRRDDGRPLVRRTTSWTGPDFHPAAGRPTDLVAIATLLCLGLLLACVPDGGRHRLARRAVGAVLLVEGAVGGIIGALLVVSSLTPHAVARMNGNLSALSPLLVANAVYGARLLAGRLGRVGIERLRALLVALSGPILVDLAGHLVGVGRQAHLGLLGLVLVCHLAAFAALRRAGAAYHLPQEAP
jgi:hypothetical protein